MLSFVPAVIDLYRPLKPHLRWTMQVLVSFAGRDGRCWPSIRKLAEHADISKSTAARHLTELSRTGIISRKRRPGGVYEYVVDGRFLPRAPVSQLRERTVPSAPRQETEPLKQRKGAHARFGDSADLPASPPWEQRVRSFVQRGFWLPAWGAKPTEPGCLAPLALLQAALPASG